MAAVFVWDRARLMQRLYSSLGFGRDVRLKPEDEKGLMAGRMRKGGVNS